MAVLADADHRIRAVLVDDATQLGLDDVERLIPADLDELRYAAVCGLIFAGSPPGSQSTRLSGLRTRFFE